MNIVEIVKVFQDKVNNSTDSEEVIYLSKIIELLNMGVVKTVNTYADLLTLNPSEKEIYFVEDERNLYYYSESWFLLLAEISSEIRTWGDNTNGRLGDGTTTNRSSPVLVVGDITDWITADAGQRHNLAIRANGTMWAWGSNQYARLGDNTVTDRSSPVSVVGGFTDWISAEAGGDFSLAIRANGTLWAWGANGFGNLGDNTNIGRSSPVSVVGGFTDWISASAGGLHSLGVRANGTLWSWGNNEDGRLGEGTTTSRSSPVLVVGGFTDWISASGGYAHSLGVRANGTMWSWGSNGNGRLGDNSVTDRSSPVSVVGGFTDWTQVSAGNDTSLGLRANGTLWAWGGNFYGRLGDGTTTNRSSPVSVVGGFTDWISFSAGEQHSLGIRTDGTLWSWGANFNGQLGDPAISGRSSPGLVVGGFTDWILASGGGYSHSLGLRNT